MGRLRQVAIAHIGLGQFQHAADAYESALRLDERDWFVHRNLGIIYLQSLDESEKGLQHLRRSLELAPAQHDADQMRAVLEKRAKAQRKQNEM